MANFLEKYYEERGWTFLSREEKGKLSDSILFGHSKDEIIRFASKHGIKLAKSWTKGDISNAIVSGLAQSGYDYETMLSMVSTPSSYK